MDHGCVPSYYKIGLWKKEVESRMWMSLGGE